MCGLVQYPIVRFQLDMAPGPRDWHIFPAHKRDSHYHWSLIVSSGL